MPPSATARPGLVPGNSVAVPARRREQIETLTEADVARRVHAQYVRRDDALFSAILEEIDGAIPYRAWRFQVKRMEEDPDPELIVKCAARILERTIEIIRRRIDELGTREPTIQRQGEDRIVVQLPGVTDTERAKDIIGKTAKMTFRFIQRPSSRVVVRSRHNVTAFGLSGLACLRSIFLVSIIV